MRKDERSPFKEEKMMVRMLPIVMLIAVLGAAGLSQTPSPTGPREQLKQYVDQLQRSPSDDGLRTKLIQLALSIAPRPDPPDAAIEASGRGKFLLDHAKTPADFAAGAAEFAQASRLAPWFPAYYFNQGVLLGKAERYPEAIKALRWYLVADPTADDRATVIERIGELQAAADSAARNAAIQAQAENARSLEANRNRAKREIVAQFMRLVERNHYDNAMCMSAAAIKANDFGCNLAEYNGKNWNLGSASDRARNGDNIFVMLDDGRVALCSARISATQCADRSTMIGTVIDTDISWTNSKGEPIWVDHNNDWSFFAWGFRPVDDSRFDPRRRYSYFGYSTSWGNK